MKSTTRSRLLALTLVLSAVSSLTAQDSATPANRAAQTVTTVAPKYPYLMRRAEATAEVTVSFKVDAKGVVTGAKIVDSNNSEFVNPTLDAVKQWTFAPAIKDGKAIESQMVQKFTFSVRDQAESERAAQIASKKRTN